MGKGKIQYNLRLNMELSAEKDKIYLRIKAK